MRGERILIVEDETIIAEDLRCMLSELGYQVISGITTGLEAIHAAQKERPDLILMDINLRGEIDGVEAVQRIRANQDIPVLYISAYPENDVVQSRELGHGYGYIPKPFDPVEIGAMVSLTLNTRRLMKGMREAVEWAVQHQKRETE